MIYRIYEKSVRIGSVADNYNGNAGRRRTGGSEINIVVVQQSIPHKHFFDLLSMLGRV
jgi:hypothetical protein